jgi:DNA-binding XRE family transcriptional regulator
MTENEPGTPQDGDRIRALRKERLKINGTQFAERLGIYRETLVNIETNKKPASLALMIKIAAELGEPIDGLLRKVAA